MAIHRSKISLTGGPVEIEVAAGNLHVFSYRCILMDATGGGQTQVMAGNTIDTLPDKDTLPQTPAQLSGLFLAVDGLLSPIKVTAKKQNFNIDIHVRQNGVDVAGSPVVVKGQLTSTIPVLEHVEL